MALPITCLKTTVRLDLNFSSYLHDVTVTPILFWRTVLRRASLLVIMAPQEETNLTLPSLLMVRADTVGDKK